MGIVTAACVEDVDRIDGDSRRPDDQELALSGLGDLDHPGPAHHRLGDFGGLVSRRRRLTLQRKAIELLTPENTMAETRAIQQEFGRKKTRMLNGLRDLGFVVDAPPGARSTFGQAPSICRRRLTMA